MAIKKHLYDVLCVQSDASVQTITRAYRKLALEYHPDRNPSGAQKFKQINNAYATLSDEQRRRLYDATGITCDQSGMNEENGVDANGRPTQQHSSELQAQLHMFFATYANSVEEEQDVARHYTQCDGNFRAMMKEHLLFDNGKPNEIERLHDVVQKLIKQGKLTQTATWQRTTSPKALRKIRTELERERVEAEAALAEMGLQSNCNEQASVNSNNAHSDKKSSSPCGALQAMIQQRQKASWANMLSNLQDKYVTKDRKRKREGISEYANSDADKENEENAMKTTKVKEKAKKKTKVNNDNSSNEHITKSGKKDKKHKIKGKVH